MSKKNVIDPKYLPLRPIGVLHWLVVVMALDYFGAAGWVWGLVCGVLGLTTVCTWWAKSDESMPPPGVGAISDLAYPGDAADTPARVRYIHSPTAP